MPSDPALRDEAASRNQRSQWPIPKPQDEASKAENEPTLFSEDDYSNVGYVQTPCHVAAIQCIHQQERPGPISTTQQAHCPDIGPLISENGDVLFCDRSRVEFVLPRSVSEHTSAHLFELRLCIVDILVPTTQGSPFTNLTIRNVKESLLKCGRISGPAFIANAKDSVVVVACKQLRVHESSRCVFYLHCGSRPIIENCTDIKFAPLPKSLVRTSWISTCYEAKYSCILTLGDPLLGASTLSDWDQPMVSD